MPPAPIPADEAARLAALRDLGILDTPPEAEFDAIVRATASACGVPIAALGLIDKDREWFKSQIGLGNLSEVPRDAAFCGHTIHEKDVLEVQDATLDARFMDYPAATGPSPIRFYAAASLRLSDGSAVGALCVADHAARRLTPAQREILRCQAAVAAKCLETWRVGRSHAAAARDLRISEARLRRLYEATPAMLHSVDERGILLSVSDFWLSKLGYQRSEVVGRPFADFLGPRSRGDLESFIAPTMAGQSRDQIACQLRQGDGGLMDVLLSTILDDDGEAPRGLTILEDVTARRRAEQALATEHSRLSNIIDGSGLGTWEWNVQTGEARLSEAWAAMIGWSLDTMPARFSAAFSSTRAERVHADDLPRAQAALAQYVADGGARYEVELRVRHRDGHWIWMLDRGAVITRTPDGRPEWLFGTRQDISSLKRQQEALRKSEEFLERTGRLAGVGGWELDLVTQQLYWSAETKRIHGVAEDHEPSLATALDFYAPRSRPVIEAAVARSVATGEGWDLELELVRRDGTPFWARAVGGVTFVDGKAVRLSGAFQDVTTEVAHRLEMEQAHNRIRLAAESGGIGIWDWDFETNVITADGQRRRLFGLSPDADAQTYVDWRRYVHPDDLGSAEQAVADARAGLAPYNAEYRVIWDDGSVHHLRSAAHILRDPAGHPVRMVGVTWDVTDSRTLAAELKRNAELQAEASERESALFRNNPDSLSIIRIEEEAGERVFRFETISPSVIGVTGIPAENLIGQRVGTGLPPEAARELVRSCDECVDRGETTSFAFTIETPRGTRDFEGARTPIRSPGSGKITRLASSMRDVTERKRLAAAKRHGQKLEAIGTLAAGVAHDFNNLLQSISGALEVVQDEVKAGSTAHEFAGLGIRAARRGSYLTHHLLAYARKQTLRPSLVAVPALLRDIEKLLARTLAPGIRVTVYSSAGPQIVRVDSGQIQTAILNLSINATHAMPGGGLLTIRSHTVEEDGRDWVVVSVTDTGTGMDAETLARAVEPFFTTKGLNGTGLGLSMVHGFAEQSGGRLTIHSELGHGTTMLLYLPAVSQALPGEEPARPAAAAHTADVLLVDDDADVLVTLGAFLEKAGFRTVRANNADQALAILGTGATIDAVVTDYAMPGMNGDDLITELRETHPKLPAIVVSGFADLAEVSKLGDGVVMLHKPFPRELLVDTLHRVMGKVPKMDDLYARLRPRLDEP